VSSDGALSTAEAWLVRLLWLHAALSVLFVILAWRDGIAEHADLRFVVNTTGKDGLFAIMSVAAALAPRRRLGLVALLIAAYGFLMLGEIFELLLADPRKVLTFPSDRGATTYLLSWLAADAVLVALFALLYRAASSRR